ncbi:[Ni-Fe] hydrogenase, large subunit [Arcobacter venerupis]|uniref:[Ni-Fe] hydrogenase, large subunit n=1 Tax=Arcobacter venerupis TaxID=1054033 RepID=A0AAE7BAH7_9BACT|nr:nickel-dependent hydrogenase large subunit [Arcobacter venerupis]QKF66797.1 [Ni-Fe] hydrogenase, large subunit [Arcobacter venerupis]RWS49793.1 Ni/Fe hydrogenase [Arcobacter venerupis]
MKTIDLVERIEGEAKLHCTWENNKVSNARIDFLNFRGFEYILEGKSPLDALVYTPRICGICGQAHLKATVEALENIYENINEKLQITQKAKLLREIGLNIEIIDSHIKWFYMFILPDIIKLDTNDLGIYAPLKGTRWMQAQKAASETIKALAVIGGQWPHTSYMIPGGVMSDPTKLDLIMMQNYLQTAISFFENSISGVSLENYLAYERVDNLEDLSADLKYFKDLAFKYSLDKYGKSYNRFITLGESSLFKSGRIKRKLVNKLDFSKIVEDDTNTFSLNKNDNTQEKHTWSKSVSYDEIFFETGPLSRAIISNRKFIKEIHKSFDDSVFSRVMARVDEIAHLLNETNNLISQVDISELSYVKPKFSLKDIENGSGMAVVEACRGSLLHNITIEKGLIKSYDVITPTVWNLGPENKTQKGIAQKAIIGSSSIEIAKIVLRSFDVCSVCTTH